MWENYGNVGFRSPKKTDGSIEVLFAVGNCISENGMKIHDHQGQGLELEVIQSISQLQVSWWRFTFFPGLMPFGVFHKWYMEVSQKLDGLFHGKSYYKWMRTGGTPISGNIHLFFII